MTLDVHRKLRTVTDTPEGELSYSYDVQGNRYRIQRGGEFTNDIYVRNASGNIIAIYEKDYRLGGTIIDRIKEFDIYGSSRMNCVFYSLFFP